MKYIKKEAKIKYNNNIENNNLFKYQFSYLKYIYNLIFIFIFILPSNTFINKISDLSYIHAIYVILPIFDYLDFYFNNKKTIYKKHLLFPFILFIFILNLKEIKAYEEINITIKGNGTQQIVYNGYYST